MNVDASHPLFRLHILHARIENAMFDSLTVTFMLELLQSDYDCITSTHKRDIVNRVVALGYLNNTLLGVIMLCKTLDPQLRYLASHYNVAA